MKKVQIITLISIALITILPGCGEDNDPVAQLVCNNFDEGKNAVMDAEEKEMKCVYGVSNYHLIKDSFEEDGESVSFEFDREFYVTFSTYESYYDENGAPVHKSQGLFEVGAIYDSEARTGNATFFSPATLEISNIDRDNELISGKITSKAPIKWVEGTPVMGYVIFTFTDLKM